MAETPVKSPQSMSNATTPNATNLFNSNSPTFLTQLPEDYCRLVVLPLHQGQCSNKTFKNILTLIDHLSSSADTKKFILQNLIAVSKSLCLVVLMELKRLLPVLESSTDEVEIQRITLTLFTPPTSSQAKLLRVLKAVDYIHSKKKDKRNSSNNNGRSLTPDFPEMNDIESLLPDDPLIILLHEDEFNQLWQLLQRTLHHVHESTNLLFVATVLLPLIECLMIACKYLMFVQKILDQKSLTNSITTDGDVHGSEVLASAKSATAVVNAPSRSAASPKPSHFPLDQQKIRSLMDVSSPTPTLPPSSSTSNLSTASNTAPQDLFFSFTEKHRKILNTLVHDNAKLLRGSFSLLIHNPKILEFDNKRNYFTQQLHKKPPEIRPGVLYVNVRRQYIFQDSYYQLQNHTGDEVKFSKLSVHFNDEEAADYGGVTREWYQELTKEMFNPNYALFTPSAEKTGVTYQPNPSSWVNPSHLLYFKFVGRVIGKAIYDNRLLDCYFTRSVYKHILGKSVDTSDMEAVDPEYYSSLKWIMENSIENVLDLTFSTEVEEFGQQKIVDLKPTGRHIIVTDATKNEYVQLIVEERLITAIKEQINAFLSGFHDIVPRELVGIFSEKELELLISGVPDIDIDDWKNNTDYRGFSSVSPQVLWFWRTVRSFTQEERAKLLQFTTGYLKTTTNCEKGTSKVPLDGFSKLQGIGGLQKFQIHKDFGNTNRLPSAHTCFNQLDIPDYESYERLRERLYVAITEGTVGFGFE